MPRGPLDILKKVLGMHAQVVTKPSLATSGQLTIRSLSSAKVLCPPDHAQFYTSCIAYLQLDLSVWQDSQLSSFSIADTQWWYANGHTQAALLFTESSLLRFTCVTVWGSNTVQAYFKCGLTNASSKACVFTAFEAILRFLFRTNLRCNLLNMATGS